MKQKDILFILISSFILILVWMGFNLWHIKQVSTLSEPVSQQLIPINPYFDKAVIQKIMQRQQIAPLYKLNQATSSASLTPTPSLSALSPTPISTSSVTPAIKR